MGFDLGALEGYRQKQESGIDVEILLPDGEPSGMVFKVAAADSERVKARAREITNELTKAGKGAGDVLEEGNLAIRCAAVISWQGVQMEGKDFPCTPDNVVSVLRQFSFIADQVAVASEDRALFFGKSSKGSAKPLSEQ